MGLFDRKRVTARSRRAGQIQPPVTEHGTVVPGADSPDETGKRARAAALAPSDAPVSSVRTLWGDRLGFLATRSLQVIIVVVLAAGAVWGIRTLSTVFIPIVLALIFASTFWPVTKWLRSKGMPAALAATLE
ncbi:MAG: AI-2E family transporter, partial [Leucobacter sp.]|nr:AI-2E family transporter [Leucobacter sp.]